MMMGSAGDDRVDAFVREMGYGVRSGHSYQLTTNKLHSLHAGAGYAPARSDGPLGGRRTPAIRARPCSLSLDVGVCWVVVW